MDDLQQEIDADAVSNDIRDVRHVRLNYNNNEADLVKLKRFIPNNNAAKTFSNKFKKTSKKSD